MVEHTHTHAHSHMHVHTESLTFSPFSLPLSFNLSLFTADLLSSTLVPSIHFPHSSRSDKNMVKTTLYRPCLSVEAPGHTKARTQVLSLPARCGLEPGHFFASSRPCHHSHHVPEILTFWTRLHQAKFFPSPGPLYQLFSLPGKLLPWLFIQLTPFYCSDLSYGHYSLPA
jgi:hypothetical protein